MAEYLVSTETSAWRIVDDEAVILHTRSSAYFGANPTGTWIWSLLVERPRGAEEVARLHAECWGRPADEAAREVAAFLKQLRDADLVLAEDARPGPDDAVPTPPAPTSDPYEPPQLVRFGDLEALILSAE